MRRILIRTAVLSAFTILAWNGGCPNSIISQREPTMHTEKNRTSVDNDITAAAFGDMYDMSDGALPVNRGGTHKDAVSGDTWYTTWGADGTVYMSHDDGLGFDNVGGLFARNRLCRLDGDPNLDTATFRGVNLNPGILGQTIPHYEFTDECRIGYSSSIHDQDGILYIIRHNWSPARELWPPIDSSIIKSTDGGKTWVNHLGQTGVLADQGHAMFPALPWSWLTFVQYGRGGAAPAVDNADKYTYLTATGYLARVGRTKLASLNPADFEYYKGAGRDGMLDSSWSHDMAEAAPAEFRRLSDASDSIPTGSRGVSNVVYNHALGRYVGTACSHYFSKGEGFHDTGKSRFLIYTAPHPWGPWREVMSYGIWGRAGWNVLLCNKFTTADGLKMWYTFCGEYMGDTWNYGFQYTPVYLSTGPVDRYPARDATLDGARPSCDYPAPGGAPVVTGFDKPGNKITFALDDIEQTGWHIVRIRYASPQANGNMLSVCVNGQKARRVKLSLNDKDYKSDETWTDRSDVYFLKAGRNTFEIGVDSGDQATGVMIDYIAVSRRPTFNEGTNLAPKALVTASSGDARNAVKGHVDYLHEWTAAGTSGEWIQLEWPLPVTITKVVLYDSASMQGQITSGTLTFSDGSTVKVAKLQNDGQARTRITFPPKTVTWLKFTLDTIGPKTQHAGLGELQVYGQNP